MTEITLTVAGGDGATITDGGIVFGTTGSYSRGTTLDGLPYVIAPTGVILTEPTPASTTVSSRYMNGQMQDPQREAATPHQALDSGLGGTLTGYDAAKAASFGAIVLPNSTLIKADSKTGATDDRSGYMDQMSGLYIVAARKASNVMAPFVWPSGDLANRPWRAVDIDAMLAALTSFAALGSEIPWATLAPYLNRLDLGMALTSTVVGGYQYIAPYQMGDSATSANYDPYKTRLQDAMLIGLMSDTWSTSDKTAAAIRLCQRGCQVGESVVAFAQAINEDGGHYNSQYAPCMAWLFATGRTAQYSTWIPLVGGNTYGQYYTVTAGQFDPHSSASLPYIARLRNVTEINAGVAGANCQVKTQGYSPASGLTADTASNAEFKGLNLVKQSGGNLALINTFTQGASGADHTFELAAPITGLTVGDPMYAAQVSPMSAGTADWVIRSATTYPNLPNPSYYAEYRDLQYTAISHLFVHNLGMHGAAMAPAKAYLQRVIAGGLPIQTGTISSTITGSSNTVAAAFLSAYGSTLLAKTQLGL